MLPNELFVALGGKGSSFLPETTDRVFNFFAELQMKRDYEKFTTFESTMSQMIILKKIRLFSFCEHHLLPFFGYCSIGYIPNNKILGLSKFQRLVDKIASKPSTQETITDEIATALKSILNPIGLAVAVDCVHSCMFGRGIQTSTITASTLTVLGELTEPTAKNEFLSRISQGENIFQ